MVAGGSLSLQHGAVPAEHDEPAGAPGSLPAGAARLLWMAEHRPARVRRGESLRPVHVQEFLSNQCDAARRHQSSRRLSAGRRVMSATAAARAELSDRPIGYARPFAFGLATEADDRDIRRLLRAHPMPGAIAVSLEREPHA